MTIKPRSIEPKIGEPDIDESYIRQQDVVVLKTLLIDRTMTALNHGTPVNIKWAIDDYEKDWVIVYDLWAIIIFSKLLNIWFRFSGGIIRL